MKGSIESMSQSCLEELVRAISNRTGDLGRAVGAVKSLTVTKQMRKTYASKQRSLTIEPVDDHLVGINIVSSSDRSYYS